MGENPLDYARPASDRRPGQRLASSAFLLSVLATPPATIGLVVLTGDTLDDWLHGPVLHAAIYAIGCGPGLVAFSLGLASQSWGRHWLGIAAAVIGTGSAAVNAVLLAAALAN